MLRHSTAEQHDAIERTLNLQQPDFSHASYLALLKNFYGDYAPWERTCAPLLETMVPGFLAARLKIPLLHNDLTFLGADDEKTLPRCMDIPLLLTPIQALGSMHVIEGSTLGGRPLSRHFSQILQIHPATGGAFFAGYGEQTGPMWKEFAALVEQHRPIHNASPAVDSAIFTFQHSINGLSARAAPPDSLEFGGAEPHKR